MITLIISLAVSCQLSLPVWQAGAASCFAQNSGYVRVAIVQDVSSLNLRVNGFYEIMNSPEGKVWFRGKDLKTTVTAYKNGILIGGKNFAVVKLYLKTNDPEAITLNGRRFRGNIQFIKKENAHLTVVNYIDLEDYIKGILYHESSHYWPQEALKAQAIVCRSYALYQMQQNASRDYDLTSDIYSQVYGGKTSERYRTNKAVEETKGQILVYQNKALPAYYHATCAGHTEDALLLWNIDIPPLKGVPCGFCKDSPHFRWHSVLSCAEIAEKLTKADFQIKNLKDIVVLDKDSSGRIVNLRISDAQKDVIIPAKDFRNIIGPNIIRSTNFDVKIVNHDAVFEGLGWGHGVGFCQWGAYFMAKQGYKYAAILKYYYPGTAVSLIVI